MSYDRFQARKVEAEQAHIEVARKNFQEISVGQLRVGSDSDKFFIQQFNGINLDTLKKSSKETAKILGNVIDMLKKFKTKYGNSNAAGGFNRLEKLQEDDPALVADNLKVLNTSGHSWSDLNVRDLVLSAINQAILVQKESRAKNRGDDKKSLRSAAVAVGKLFAPNKLNPESTSNVLDQIFRMGEEIKALVPLDTRIEARNYLTTPAKAFTSSECKAMGIGGDDGKWIVDGAKVTDEQVDKLQALSSRESPRPDRP